jgi:SAM-dependent methyltransferase
VPVNFQTDPRYRSLDPALVRRLYEVEKSLRARLLSAPAAQRATVFLRAYDELFERCPWHPALGEAAQSNTSRQQRNLVEALKPFLPRSRDARVLEIGCGMGELLTGLSEVGYDCTGLDVSRTRIERLQRRQRPRLRFQQAEGTRLPFDGASFDLVISIQLFEHLHPDDAETHLRETCRVLKPGGRYLLETPNKWAGPGDVSRFFSDQPEGFHLREYSIAELSGLMSLAGYAQVSVVRWKKEILSARAAIRLERLWKRLPRSVRRQRTFGLHNPLYLARKEFDGNGRARHDGRPKDGIPGEVLEDGGPCEIMSFSRLQRFWNLI